MLSSSVKESMVTADNSSVCAIITCCTLLTENGSILIEPGQQVIQLAEGGWVIMENGEPISDVFPGQVPLCEDLAGPIEMAAAVDNPAVFKTNGISVTDALIVTETDKSSNLKASRTAKESAKGTDHLTAKQADRVAMAEIVTAPNVLTFGNFMLTAPQADSDSSGAIGAGPDSIAGSAGGLNVTTE
jgi:hypothetical protein